LLKNFILLLASKYFICLIVEYIVNTNTGSFVVRKTEMEEIEKSCLMFKYDLF